MLELIEPFVSIPVVGFITTTAAVVMGVSALATAGAAAYTASENKKGAQAQAAAIAGAPAAELAAQKENLPELYQIQLEYGPKFQELELDGQAKSAERMAEVVLEIQQKYGSAFIQEGLKQLKESDPEGWEARKDLYERIQTQIAKDDAKGPDKMAEGLKEAFMEELESNDTNKRDTGASETVEAKLLADFGLGAELDDSTRREVEQSVRRGQAARGQTRGNAALFEEASTTGLAGEARKQDRLENLMGYLTSGETVNDLEYDDRAEKTNRLSTINAYLGSGTTPDDLEYRRNQQNLGNLSAFMSGSTPTAQFSQLSGANAGAAPFMPQTPGRVIDPASTTVGAANRVEAETNLLNNQPNPWLTGLGIGLQGVGAAGALGWEPFKK